MTSHDEALAGFAQAVRDAYAENAAIAATEGAAVVARESHVVTAGLKDPEEVQQVVEAQHEAARRQTPSAA